MLKGHEDLRQDERVMQLFGLVNTLLAGDQETSKRHLGYASLIYLFTYHVCVPLFNQSVSPVYAESCKQKTKNPESWSGSYFSLGFILMLT